MEFDKITVGIGVTLCGRLPLATAWLEFEKQIKAAARNSVYEIFIFYTNDDPRAPMGIAYRKNECLKALSDCDYIFLFDDDCFPSNPKSLEWIDFFVDAAQKTQQWHFVIGIPSHGHQVERTVDTGTGYMLEVLNGSAGCFLFLTRAVVKIVGGFHKGYGRYGYEHVGYSRRIFKAGLSLAPYVQLKDGYKHLISLDADMPGIHASVLTTEEKLVFAKENEAILLLDEQTIHQPL